MQACRRLPFLSTPFSRQILIVSRRGFATTAATTTSNPIKPEIYDVVCVGGGPAGLSLVNALRASKSTSHLKIALIESQELSKNAGPRHTSEDIYSNRCSSLTPASVAFLQDIGAWSHINQSRVQPYDEMKVWDGVSNSRITFDWADTLAPPSSTQRTIAYMTENNNLTSGLLSRAHELGGISILDNVRVSDIRLGDDNGPGEIDLRSWPIVTLSSGATLAARLLVGADGANSSVRAFAGITSRGWDYNRHGVVATLKLNPNTASSAYNLGTAYQRFLPTGPVALLPLPNNTASLVWSTLPSHASLLKSLGSKDFTSMVNAAFRLTPPDLAYLHTLPPTSNPGQHADEISWRLQHTPFDPSLVPAEVTEVEAGSVASFPLRMRHADTYVGERVALLGDAAHTIHPLAGQGLNQGQADVKALVETIVAAVETGGDLGSTLALEGYARERYAKNHVLMGVVDKLHKLFAVENAVVVAARSVGLDVVNNMGALKGFFMRRAGGG